MTLSQHIRCPGCGVRSVVKVKVVREQGPEVRIAALPAGTTIGIGLAEELTTQQAYVGLRYLGEVQAF